jgi:hypothetical protein
MSIRPGITYLHHPRSPADRRSPDQAKDERSFDGVYPECSRRAQDLSWPVFEAARRRLAEVEQQDPAAAAEWLSQARSLIAQQPHSAHQAHTPLLGLLTQL